MRICKYSVNCTQTALLNTKINSIVMKINNYSFLKTAALSMVLGFSALQAAAQMPPLLACPPNYRPAPGQGCGSANNAYISAVKTSGGLANFTNSGTACGTTNPAWAWSDYTADNSLLVKQEALKNVTIDVTWKGGGTYTSTLTKIYVDWNRNGVFDLPDEYASNPGTITGVHPHEHKNGTTKSITIKVPGNAKQGLTRMRIVTSSLGPILGLNSNPCSIGGAGEVEDYRFEVVNPCIPPTVLSIANLDSKSADFAWSPRENAEFYEYIITPVDTIPHDTVVGFSFTTDNKFRTDTFQCNTKYYIMVRSICDTAGKIDRNWDKSGWIRDSFTTHPCCYEPVVTIDQIASTTARISWPPIATAYGYEYAVSINNVPPQKGNLTNSTTVVLQGLTPKTTHYVFVRARCNPTPLSEWAKGNLKTQAYVTVKDVSNEKVSIDAFPNPVSDKLTIQLNGQRSKNPKLQVIDLTGKTVYSAPVTADKTVINTNDLPAGLYIIKYSDDQHNEVTRVTKQ